MSSSYAITHDHRELQDYYGRLMALDENDYDNKSRWQNQLTWELARHAVGEEIVLYPAYEKYLGAEGKKAADKDRNSHQKTKELLEYFQRLYPQSKEFKPSLVELMEELEKHMRSEEKDELPMLEEALAKTKPESGIGGKSRSQELALSFSRTKMFVPTRGHPWMPNKPPYETVLGLLAMPVDVLADMFRKFPKEKQRTTESLSGGLK
ncbi:HHE domain protein [Morchella conica CCBAS932]|uniref:HHE domain protein n=1 Tax=Morchella conica CCBAS932 TaxID=1392247 RepID=A0A3N4KE29_9PEZI|nr:HHE domain protein [Morchella conica CCBAS932]